MAYQVKVEIPHQVIQVAMLTQRYHLLVADRAGEWDTDFLG